MHCPNCNTKLQSEQCTYTKPSGHLGDAVVYHCEDCGYEVEIQRGKRFVVFDGVPDIDCEIRNNLGVK